MCAAGASRDAKPQNLDLPYWARACKKPARHLRNRNAVPAATCGAPSVDEDELDSSITDCCGSPGSGTIGDCCSKNWWLVTGTGCWSPTGINGTGTGHGHGPCGDNGSEFTASGTATPAANRAFEIANASGGVQGIATACRSASGGVVGI